MMEETEILTCEITTIFNNIVEVPDPSNGALAELIKNALIRGGYTVDNVTVTKVQHFYMDTE